MMKNYDKLVERNDSTICSCFPDHLYRILIFGGPGSCKNNVLLNLLKHHWSDIDKIYLYVKDPFKSKYKLLMNGREKVGIKELKKT